MQVITVLFLVFLFYVSYKTGKIRVVFYFLPLVFRKSFIPVLETDSILSMLNILKLLLSFFLLPFSTVNIIPSVLAKVIQGLQYSHRVDRAIEVLILTTSQSSTKYDKFKEIEEPILCKYLIAQVEKLLVG